MSVKKQQGDRAHFELWELLARTQHAIINARELELREHGITPTQAYILLRIYQLRNKATQAQIANFIFRKQNTVSINVKRMEKQGLLKKNRNGNRITLSLTDKGEQIYKKTLKRQTIDNIMSSLSQKQSEQLRASLEMLFTAAANELAKFSNDAFLKNILKNFSNR